MISVTIPDLFLLFVLTRELCDALQNESYLKILVLCHIYYGIHSVGPMIINNLSEIAGLSFYFLKESSGNADNCKMQAYYHRHVKCRPLKRA